MKESFRDFMQRALHDPERGYYARRISTVGARGDFSTSATLGTDLGRGIARWLVEEAAATGVRHVIEIGGGDGSLMDAVQRELGWWRRRKLQFFMVDSSRPLRDQQKSRLGGRVSGWFDTLPEALAACEGCALLFHNELMDAFPVHLVEWNDGWQEVHLDWQNGVPREVFEPAAISEPEVFSVLGTPGQPKQRREVADDLRQWFLSWLPAWRRGSMLSIDYGDEFPALYHRRPRGTLRGYLMQQRVEGHELYLNMGRQDITADINFTDVRRWLSAAGLKELHYETQAELLARLGVPPDPRLAAAHHAFRCLSVRAA